LPTRVAGFLVCSIGAKKMQCRFWIRGPLLAAVLASSVVAWAFPPEGKYREELKNPFRGQNFSLVKTLHLRIGGKAEMYFEYKGDPPVLDLWMVDEFGALMEGVRDYRKLKHSGTWKPSGNRILVELTKLEGGGREGSRHSAIEFELFGDELQARKQDKGDYGDRLMRLQLLERYDSAPIPGPGPTPIPVPPGESFDPSKRKGNYAWAEDVAGLEGPSVLVRRLKLNGDKSAELVSEYLGAKPRLEAGSSGQYGSLFAEVVARRKISHKGAWKEIDGKVVVDLDRIGSGEFAQNVHSRFVLGIQGKDLTVSEQDGGDYGSRGSPFRRDWSPSAPSLPQIPGPPGGPIGPTPNIRQPKVLEMDVQTAGNGTASHQGNPAVELSQARFTFAKNGRFEIRVKGSQEAVFKGVYELKGDDRLVLEVSEAFGRSASGAGTLDLGRGGAPRKLMLRGFAGDRRYTIAFESAR